MSKKIKSDIMLLISAIIWGSAFVAQKAGTVLGPFTYNGIRTMIGGLVLIPVVFLFKKANEKKGPVPEKAEEEKASERKSLIIGGICCGLALCAGTNLQQFGLYFGTDAGKAGFITSLYIVIVPLLGLFFRKKARPLIWGCIVFGMIGFYLLTMAGKGSGFDLTKNDFFILLCAVMFACHIQLVGYFSPRCDGVKLSCIQFLIAGLIGIILMFIFEEPSLPAIIDCWAPILYCGVFSSGVAYTLQILAQQHAEPAVASLIMSLESVFSVLFGALLLHETMTLLEGLGCIVIFAAVIASQLPSKEERLRAAGEK